MMFNFKNIFKKKAPVSIAKEGESLPVIGTLQFGDNEIYITGETYNLGYDAPRTTVMSWDMVKDVSRVVPETKVFYEVPLKEIPKELLTEKYDEVHLTLTHKKLPERVTFTHPFITDAGNGMVKIATAQAYVQTNQYCDWLDTPTFEANIAAQGQKKKAVEHLAELLVHLFCDHAEKGKRHTVDEYMGLDEVELKGMFNLRTICRVVGGFTADDDNEEFIRMFFEALTGRYPLGAIESRYLDGTYNLLEVADEIINFLESDGDSFTNLDDRFYARLDFEGGVNE